MRHTFILCSELDCTSVWPEWWNQCRNAPELQRGWVKNVSLSETASFSPSRQLQKRPLTRAWSQTVLALLCSESVQSPQEGEQRELLSHLYQNMSLWKSCSERKLSTSVWHLWLKVSSGSWLDVVRAKYVWEVIWTALCFTARTCLERTGKRKKEDSILLEFCCTLTLLEGISNWINNCLIPISQLDLSALTEEAVLWERDGRRVRGREKETQTDTGKQNKHKGHGSRNRRRRRKARGASCYNRNKHDSRWTRQMRTYMVWHIRRHFQEP